MAIRLDERLGASPDVLVNVVDGQSVLLNLKTERYFSLDEVGTSMWQALTTSPSLRAACERLLGEYDAEPQRLESDLQELAGKLVENGLLEVRGG